MWTFKARLLQLIMSWQSFPVMAGSLRKLENLKIIKPNIEDTELLEPFVLYLWNCVHISESNIEPDEISIMTRSRGKGEESLHAVTFIQSGQRLFIMKPPRQLAELRCASSLSLRTVYLTILLATLHCAIKAPMLSAVPGQTQHDQLRSPLLHGLHC